MTTYILVAYVTITWLIKFALCCGIMLVALLAVAEMNYKRKRNALCEK